VVFSEYSGFLHQQKPCYNIYATIGSAGFRHYSEFGDGKNQVKTDSECLVIYITGIKIML
jgi:hypothetical protein